MPFLTRTAGILAALIGARSALVLCLWLPAIGMAQDPESGMFLVATGDVRGSLFRETVKHPRSLPGKTVSILPH